MNVGQDGRDRAGRGHGHVEDYIGDGQVVDRFPAHVDKNGAGARLNLLQSHAGIDGLMAGPGRALQVGEEVNFLLLEFSRGGAEHIDHGIESSGQIGVAVRQA